MRLARGGADVVVNFFTTAPRPRPWPKDPGLGRRAVVVRADVGEQMTWSSCWRETARRSAGWTSGVQRGIGYNRGVMDQKVKGWDWTMNINARSALFWRRGGAMMERGAAATSSTCRPRRGQVMPGMWWWGPARRRWRQ
jgi:enoyl-[acyl-carrier protein] reductase III